MMKIVAFLFACGSLIGGECLPVHADHITASDLAIADKAFEQLPADKRLMLAPRPGVQRQVTVGDLRRIATREAIESVATEGTCFAWPVRDIDPQQLHRILTTAFGKGTVEITEISKVRIPEGRLVFDRRSLSMIDRTAGHFIWRGAVEYAERQSVPVWVRVRLATDTACAVASDKLNTGTVLTAETVRVSDQPVPVTVSLNCVSVAHALGKRTRRPVRAGEPLQPADIETVPAVSPGDEVQVDVYRGRAHLSFVATAEQKGTEGEQIYFRNPRGGKRFLARVSAPGRAEVGTRGEQR